MEALPRALVRLKGRPTWPRAFSQRGQLWPQVLARARQMRAAWLVVPCCLRRGLTELSVRCGDGAGACGDDTRHAAGGPKHDVRADSASGNDGVGRDPGRMVPILKRR